MQLTTIVSAVPADGIDDIRKFLPGSPNLAPFMSLSGIVSAVGALILGFIVIVSIFGVVLNAAKLASASMGNNPQKTVHAKDGLRTSAMWLLIAGLLWSAIIAFIVKAGQSIT
jgi:hypothetical protein